MRKYIKLFLVIISISFFSCEKLIEPKFDNSLTQSQLLENMAYTEGLLMKAYYTLPDDYYFESDVATDDAVTNDINSSYRSMATGNWRSTNNPISKWASSYENIFYINHFLDVYGDVVWSTDSTISEAFNSLRNVLHNLLFHNIFFYRKVHLENYLFFHFF